MAELPATVESERAGPPFEVLSPFERIAFRVMRWANVGSGADLGWAWQRFILEPIFGLILFRRLTVRGLERLEGIPYDASVLLVANHRTFFDLFVLGWILVRTWKKRWRTSFPVRANFFYENPLGLLICLLLSGGSMFPPFFRKPRSKGFNRYSLSLVLEKLRRPGNLIGFHPEGTRSKGPDPYQLLPAQPGAGELALKSRPVVVVPAFITGLTNKLLREIGASIRGSDPIVAIYGEPIDLSSFPGETRLTHHKKCADLFCDRISALMPEEKRLRQQLTSEPRPPAASRPPPAGP
ncbi:MAG TPA: lysophospholipid acyltransferase family protein [Myxococcales bacterium]|nr:lysophospholipid acyltransferase family protein [Myxococcales bacterium]